MAGGEQDSQSLVDLDVAPALSGVRPRWWRARIPVPVVALLLVVTGVLASVATYRWQAWRDARAREAILLVEAMVPATGIGSVFSVGNEDAGEWAAYLTTSLVIVNSGPLPVEVTGLVADQNGLSVSPAEGAKVIRPGIDTVGVIVTLDCAGGGVPDTPLLVTMRVRTPDGRSPEVVSPLTVRSTPWAVHLDGMCHREPG